MIDYDRFWHEPGCLPGLTAEETRQQAQQMAEWLQTRPGVVVTGEPDFAQQPGLFPGPGITADQIAASERDRRVRLPDVLRRAYARQDGGYVRNTMFRLLPLAEIVVPDDEFWEYACYDETVVPDRGLVLQFAWDEEASGGYYLNYAGGTPDDPSVFVHHHDPGDLDQTAASVTEFFGHMLETSEQPAVDWSETSKLDVIARETIDLSPISSAPAECDQVLGRLEGRLVLFTHERFPGREVFTRTILLEPLDGRSSLIEQHRPDPVRTYGLMLQPKDSDGIVCQESQRTPDGTWKNSVMHGVPVYVTFESTDRARLLDLRKTLLGEKSAARCERQDRDREKMQQTMQSAREQMQPAGLAMFAQLREKLIAGHPLDIAGLPPEAAALSGLLEQKLREAEQRAREALAGEPFNPEIQKLLRKFSEPETPE